MVIIQVKDHGSLDQGGDSESSWIQVCFENKVKRVFRWVRCDVRERDVEADSEAFGLGSGTEEVLHPEKEAVGGRAL